MEKSEEVKAKMIKGKTEFFLLLLGVIYFFLSEMRFSLLILWTHFALFSALVWSVILALYHKPKPPVFWGFVLGSNVFMLLIHIEWFLNLHNVKTSSSTSVLMFAVMPVWAYIFGGVGMLVATVAAKWWKWKRLR